MSINILIAHPNEIRDGWKIVETCESIDEIREILASPSFSWEPTTCVRAIEDYKIIYSGIFGEEHCFSVGPQSDVMLFDWRGPINDNDLFNQYLLADDGQELLYGSQRMISDKTYFRTCLECVRIVRNFWNKDSVVGRFVDAFDDWLEEKASKESMMRLGVRCNDLASRSSYTVTYNSLGACYCLSRVDDDDVTIQSIKWVNNACGNTGESNRLLLNIVRDNLPFHEIARGVIR